MEKIRCLLMEKRTGIFSTAVSKLIQVKINWIFALILLITVLSGFGTIVGSRVNVAVLCNKGNVKLDGVGI